MGTSLAHRFAEACLGCDFERQRVRVDIVVATVRQRGAKVHGWEVGQHAIFLLNLEPLLHRRHVLARHGAARGRIDEFEALAALERLERDPHFGELTGAASLLLVHVLLVDLARNGLAIGHLRLAHDAFDAEFRAHAIERHFEVQLAHAAQNRLACLAIRLQMERRIGTNHLPERGAEFLLFALDLRLHGHADHRVREAHTLEDHRIGGITECVAGFRLLHGDERDDVAGARLFDRIRFLGEHLDHAADLFALAARGVLYRRRPW